MSKSIIILVISSFVFAAICLSHAEADETTIYHSQDDKSNEHAVGYFKTNKSLARYLAYRDIPSFIAKYCHGKKSLDYGAGIGLSTQFLQELSKDGVFIAITGSQKMYSRDWLIYNTDFPENKNLKVET